MERDEPINTVQTNVITDFPSVTIKDRLKKFFGLPTSIPGEYIDNERCTWRMLIHK